MLGVGIPYTKPHLPVQDQLALIKQRGLVVTDDAKCTDALRRIGYYRLSGYWHPMRQTKFANGALEVLDDFKPDSQCAAVIDLYVFDKKLRMLMLDAIERIEVGLRVEMALQLSKRDPWAHRKQAEVHTNFVTPKKPANSAKIPPSHADWIAKLDKAEADSREEFVTHFFGKYSSALPMWMAIELWDFGALSIFLSGMKDSDSSAIATRYGLPRRDLLKSWVRSINYARNVCAHHGRLWNRAVIERPMPTKVGEIPKLDHLANDQFGRTRLYGVAVAIRWLLQHINPTSSWPERLKDHFKTFPTSPHYHLGQSGFPEGWQKLPFWN